MSLTVIGLDGGPLGAAAQQALRGARLVVGARRHLDHVAPALAGDAATRAIGAGATGLPEMIAELAAPGGTPGPVVVLASGDPGLFGVVRALRAAGLEVTVLPAVSSPALGFARLGLAWDPAVVVSAHGRDPRPALAAALAAPSAAVLTDARATLAPALLAAGRRVVAASALGTAAEELTELTPASPPPPQPHVLLVLPESDPDAAAAEPGWLAGHQGTPAGWAVPETAFAARDDMITKSEVRALVLARLGPGIGRVVWDLGAGSGSVAIESARLGSYAVAVERDQQACDRITANARSFGVRVAVVCDDATDPQALSGYPAPDAVFVGGGGGPVLATAIAARPHRLVVALAALDRVAGTAAALADAGYLPSGTQLSASRLAPLPDGAWRLAATNPVFVLWGERP